jgi:hypothetical protein
MLQDVFEVDRDGYEEQPKKSRGSPRAGNEELMPIGWRIAAHAASLSLWSEPGFVSNNIDQGIESVPKGRTGVAVAAIRWDDIRSKNDSDGEQIACDHEGCDYLVAFQILRRGAVPRFTPEPLPRYLARK